ncbi:pyridoxine 5'-phosphate oxidase C-terminal domain-containing protein [Actinomadura alba]|nr:pyridoxine 5'-phosphate oxidase C-terminal domain-containing protein [Actinomadura alba]
MTVEFWQGDKQRRHVRLVYRLSAEGWTKQMLWP